MPRRTKSKDDDTHSESPSPLRAVDDMSIDGESSGIERNMPAPEEPPYFPEQWYISTLFNFIVLVTIFFRFNVFHILQAWKSLCSVQFNREKSAGARRASEAFNS